MEKWEDIKNYEGLYKISSYGRVLSVRKNIILSPTRTISNGLCVSLSKDGKSKTMQVSRLVAIAFIPNPENKPNVDHIDGVRFHNFVENLRWCTQSENLNYELAIYNKTKYKYPIEGVGYDGKVCVEFENYKDAANKGFDRNLIKKSILTGKPYKGIDGVYINSSLFSAQLRKRYYWTNIPFDKEIQDKGIELQSILESGFTNRKKSVCIVRNYAGSVQSSNVESFKRMCNQRAKKGFLTVVYEEKDNPESVRLFTRTELEKLQTVPLGYTNCVDYMAAADLLGDGWTVEVIKHIFKGLK